MTRNEATEAVRKALAPLVGKRISDIVITEEKEMSDGREAAVLRFRTDDGYEVEIESLDMEQYQSWFVLPS